MATICNNTENNDCHAVWASVIFSVAYTDISRTTTLSSVCAISSAILALPRSRQRWDGWKSL